MPTGPTFQLDFDDIELNCSMQIGDTAWIVPIQTIGGVTVPQLVSRKKLGEIVNIGTSSVNVQLLSPIESYSLLTIATITDPPQILWNQYYFYFSKPIEVNESSLKGYYADVIFENSSKTYAELFAISSETTISSK